MANVFFETPQTPAGTERDQLQQLYGHLYRLSEQLNEAMNTIGTEQLEPEIQKVLVTAGQTAEQQNNTYVTLKSMIVKTAQIVRSEMDEISTRLEGHYQAISEDFGELTQNMSATIRATAEGVLQEYNLDERVQGVRDELGAFQTNIDAYIFTGKVYEENGIPRYGLAIGENITQTDANGNKIINDQNKVATFTSDELAFWRNDTKLAWFSSQTFYITRGYVMQSIQIGPRYIWKVLEDNALALIVT